MNNGYSICLNHWALDKSIKTELGLLLIISGLTAENGYCYASNEYFSKLFDIDETTVSRRIGKLKKKGYITVDYLRNGATVTKREIRLAEMLTGLGVFANGTVSKSAKDNNTSNSNNTSIIDFKGLLDFINTSQKREGNDKFRVINKSVQKKYNARIKDGYKKQDIINAIKNVSNNDYHKKNNYQYATPEFFSRADTLDKYGFSSQNNEPQKSAIENINEGQFTNF